MIDKTRLLNKRGNIEKNLLEARLQAARYEGAYELCIHLINECEAAELKQYGPERADGKPAFTGDSEDAPESRSDEDLSALEKILPENVDIAGVRLKEEK